MNEQTTLTIPFSLVETLPDLTDAELRVMLVLCAKFQKADGTTKASRSDLAEFAGVGQRSVFNALDGLEDRGWVERIDEPQGPYPPGILVKVLLASGDAASSDEATCVDAETSANGSEVLGEPLNVEHSAAEASGDNDEAPPVVPVDDDHSESATEKNRGSEAAHDPDLVEDIPSNEDLLVLEAVKQAYRSISMDELKELKEVGSNDQLVIWTRWLTFHGGVNPRESFPLLKVWLSQRIRSKTNR
jgi:DNA-binding MarR family transcriptional regulator